MIDNGKYTIHYSSREEIQEILLNPSISFDRIATNPHTGEKIHLHNFKNLSLRVNFRLCKINFTGSLTTFCKGNNYTNLTLSELKTAIECISEVLKKKSGEIIAHRFEFAVNIETPLSPFDYFSRFHSLKLKPFYYLHPPPGFTRPLEAYCSLQQYTIKFYDTAKWHKLYGVNLLKYEINFKKTEKANRILRKDTGESLTLATLAEEVSIKALEKFSLTTYQTIDKLPIMDFKTLRPRERQLIFAGSNPEFWQSEKRINHNTYKKTRNNYLRLKEEIEEDSVRFGDLERRITNKLSHLIQS